MVSRDQLGGPSGDSSCSAVGTLIVLHAAMQLGDGVRRENRVMHAPDILFRVPGIEPFAMDATR